MEDDRALDHIIDQLRKHDADRKTEAASYKNQCLQLQQEVAKKNQIINNLKLKCQKLQEFKRNVLHSVGSGDGDDDGLDDEALATGWTGPAGGDYGGASLGGGTASFSTPARSGGPGSLDTSHDPASEGKDFFMQARNELTFPQFQQFLLCIKSYNNGLQTKEQTLQIARQIFGPTHQQLFSAFQQLLLKQGSPMRT